MEEGGGVSDICIWHQRIVQVWYVNPLHHDQLFALGESEWEVKEQGQVLCYELSIQGIFFEAK